MNKLTATQAAFGNCQRLDEAYLNAVLQQADYDNAESGGNPSVAASGPSIPQIGQENSAHIPLELNKAIRCLNFRSLHRLLSFPLTEMISTAPPDLAGMCTSPWLKKGTSKLTPLSAQPLFLSTFSLQSRYV
jgi:hypothetical protein